jgi:hypothetical protein
MMWWWRIFAAWALLALDRAARAKLWQKPLGKVHPSRSAASARSHEQAERICSLRASEPCRVLARPCSAARATRCLRTPMRAPRLPRLALAPPPRARQVTSLLQLGGPGTQRLTAWPGAGGKKANARLRRVSAACSGAAALDAPYGDWTLMEASTGTELSSWRIFGMATNKHTGYNHQPRAADVWLLRALPRASVRAVWIKEGACALGPEWQEVDGRATSKIPDGFTSYKQDLRPREGGKEGG